MEHWQVSKWVVLCDLLVTALRWTNFGESEKLECTNYPIWKMQIQSHLVAWKLWSLNGSRSGARGQGGRQGEATVASCHCFLENMGDNFLLVLTLFYSHNPNVEIFFLLFLLLLHCKRYLIQFVLDEIINGIDDILLWWLRWSLHTFSTICPSKYCPIFCSMLLTLAWPIFILFSIFWCISCILSCNSLATFISAVFSFCSCTIALYICLFVDL